MNFGYNMHLNNLKLFHHEIQHLKQTTDVISMHVAFLINDMKTEKRAH